MKNGKRERLEFRFYEIPQGESALALTGDAWVGTYGQNDLCQHCHNLFELGCCRSGGGVLVLDAAKHEYGPGMISAIPANYPHGTFSKTVDAWEYLFIDPEALLREMYPDNLRRQAELLQAVNKRANLLRREEYPRLAELVDLALEEMRERRPYGQEAVNHLLKVFLLELIRIQEQQAAEAPWSAGSDAAMQRIVPALRYVEGHYMKPIRVAELAERCSLSEPHFRRLFDDRIGMTPMDYVNLMRVQKACKLMNQKDCSMDMVAAEVGFTSLSSFSRNFRKFLDITPYQWKLHGGNYRSRVLNYDISLQKGQDSL
jgi:AraC-like DNA-binding protein